MKRMMILVLLIMLIVSAAQAESVIDEEFIDGSAAMTQDSVLGVFTEEYCDIEPLQPDERSIDLLNDMYQFVWDRQKNPARYYDKGTQMKINYLAGGIDIDILHLTESMRLNLSGVPEGDIVTSTMHLDAEYRVGQLVIVILGVPQSDGGYEWYPYRGRVHKVSEVTWDIPEEEWKILNQQPVSFHVLTIRFGSHGEFMMHQEEDAMPYIVFSRTSDDVNNADYWHTENRGKVRDDFRIWVTPLTPPMENEVQRIGEHLDEGGFILDWFPEHRKEEALLMMPDDVVPEELIAYDIIALQNENYKDTYGDVNVEISFATDYDPEKAMIVLAGFPIKDAVEEPFVEWFVLRAEVIGESEDAGGFDTIEISFKQLNLPEMEYEPIMLVVISEPLDDKNDDINK